MLVELLLSLIVGELVVISIEFTYDDNPELSVEMRQKLYS